MSSRSLSLHERYSTSRAGIGSHPVLTYVVELYGSSTNLSQNTLQDRLRRIAPSHALLRARVVESKTNKPHWECFDTLEQDWLENRIVSLDSEVSSLSLQDVTKHLFSLGVGWGHAFNPETGDLWKVGFTTSDAGTRAYLVLAISHILTDGKGGLELLPYLIGTRAIPEQTIPADLAVRFEDTARIAPRWGTMLNVIGKAIIAPKLPTFLVPRAWSPDPRWPYHLNSVEQPAVPMLEAQAGMRAFKWFSADVSALKAVFDAHGGFTVNTLAAVCAIAAIWVSERLEYPDLDSLPIKMETPASERDASKGHPKTLGNYVRGGTTKHAVSPETNIFALAKEYSGEISSAEFRASGIEQWGLLKLIPDPEVDGSPGSRTGWEQFMLDSVHSAQPLTNSLELSNLGLLSEDGFPAKMVKSVTWLQTPGLIGAALTFNAVGMRSTDASKKIGDVAFTVSWREGAATNGRLDRARVLQVCDLLERTPAIIVSQGIEGVVTLESLASTFAK